MYDLSAFNIVHNLMQYIVCKYIVCKYIDAIYCVQNETKSVSDKKAAKFSPPPNT